MGRQNICNQAYLFSLITLGTWRPQEGRRTRLHANAYTHIHTDIYTNPQANTRTSETTHAQPFTHATAHAHVHTNINTYQKPLLNSIRPQLGSLDSITLATPPLRPGLSTPTPYNDSTLVYILMNSFVFNMLLTKSRMASRQTISALYSSGVY